MTCIIGIEHNGKVYMGGDSAMSNGYQVHRTPYPKVFKRGDLLIGWSSSFRIGQLLEYVWNPPVSDRDSIAFMVCDVVPSIQALFETHRHKWDDGLIMIGYQGELFVIYKDWQASRHDDGLMVTGSGHMFAEAAMVALSDVEPEARICRALKIAGQLSDSVCGPYYVLST